ncbi:unnamed protein product [Linum trigynum]|uniref:GH18 domain-containing protein n=1 Tax=Linum trigynum TaxID=586398 RepID=A0AAV2CQN1_9ROSI
MASRNSLFPFLCTISTIFLLPTPTNSDSPPQAPLYNTGIKAGYWQSSMAESFPPSSIQTSLFTHILYAFVEIDPQSYELAISQSDQNLMTNFTSTLHSKTPPPPKLFLSIGGGGSNASAFANMSSNPTTRTKFIASTIKSARGHNFDGLDLDWEFPQTPGDMSNLGVLLQEWRASLLTESIATNRTMLQLSAAVYFASSFFLSPAGPSYPADAINQCLDFVGAMCFDYRGSWDTSATGEPAVLFDKESNISTGYGIGSWIGSGVARAKIVMGMPMYGRTWRLKDPKVNGVGAPAVGVGPGSEGTMSYVDVLGFNSREGATVVFDNKTVSDYSFAGRSWIGYDGVETVSEKVRFAKEQKLGGYFFWALGYDDGNSSLSITASTTWDSFHG